MLENKWTDVLAIKPKEGEVGIEIEMELSDPYDWDYDYPWYDDWVVAKDGSLKHNGVEFVLMTPCKREDVPKIIKKLSDQMKKYNLAIVPSIRAGVHIHVNVQELTIGDTLKYMMCYYPLDTVLTRHCGDGRSGNLFCLRMRDAEFTQDALMKTLTTNKMQYLLGDALRYSTLNFQSLFKFGSVEFRAMGTPTDLSKISEWVDMLLCVKDYSKKVSNCWDIMGLISGMGATYWAEQVLGKHVATLEYPEMEWDIIQDSRAIQHVAHKLSKKGY